MLAISIVPQDFSNDNCGTIIVVIKMEAIKMVAFLVAIIIWFPFSVPKDTTPKVVIVDETKTAVTQRGDVKNTNVHIVKDKQITASIKVRLVIPHRGQRIAKKSTRKPEIK